VLDELGRIDEAVVYAGECRDRMRRWGIEREMGNFLASDTADRLRRLGRWTESELVSGEVLDQPVTGVTALVTHHAAGALAGERGDFAEAEHHLLRAAEIGRRDRSPQRGGPTFAALGALWLWEGRLDDAREVLALLADGRTNRQIGSELFISAKTASAHVSRIFAKLGVANRAEAAGVAHRLGLAPDRSP
jgi:DNA-binding CsgD family transcriptional regulator